MEFYNRPLYGRSHVFLTYTVFAAIRYIGALLNSLIFISKMYHKRCLKSVYCVMLGKHINRNVAFLL